jgi:hypothetical protein
LLSGVYQQAKAAGILARIVPVSCGEIKVVCEFVAVEAQKIAERDYIEVVRILGRLGV